MKDLFNLHTHTHYCDGSSEPIEYIEQALIHKFHTLGFSGHAPVPFPNHFAISDERLDDYIHEIKSLRTQYKDQLSIFLSLEIDYIPEIVDDFSSFKSRCDLDYIIGSVHLVKGNHPSDLWFIDGSKQEIYDDGLQKVFGGDIRKGVKAYYHQINKMIESQSFEILGHFDKIKMHNKNRYFTEDEDWYIKLVDESLELIKQKNLIVEVNTRGLYKKRSDSLFPGNEILKKLLKLNIPVTISSDAHKPEELPLYIEETKTHLNQLGFKEIWCIAKEGWKAISMY